MSIIPKTMSAVLTTGHGGYEVLEYRNNIEVPTPNSDQVLIKSLSVSLNCSKKILKKFCKFSAFSLEFKKKNDQ